MEFRIRKGHTRKRPTRRKTGQTGNDCLCECRLLESYGKEYTLAMYFSSLLSSYFENCQMLAHLIVQLKIIGHTSQSSSESVL